MIPKRYIAAFLGCIAVLSLRAQEYHFRPIGKEHGLSQSRVNAILQDSEGFIWIGTDDGLNRYNGKDFTIYKNDPRHETSLSDNWINCLLEEPGAGLWIGTIEGGLNFYDKYRGTFRAYRDEPQDAENPVHDKVYALVRRDAQSLWVGTHKGLHLFDTRAGEYISYPVLTDSSSMPPQDQVRALLLDREGILWIGTFRSGLYSYNQATGRFTAHTERDAKGAYRFSGTHRIRSLYQDSGAAIWVGYESAGLSRLDRRTGIFTHYLSGIGEPQRLPHGRVTGFLEDRFGQLWVGTGGGLCVYNSVQDNFSVIRADHNPYSLRDNQIRVLFEDRAHSLWLGTEMQGVAVFHRSSGRFNHVVLPSHKGNPDRISEPVVAFAEDPQQQIWIGTQSSGIVVYDRRTGAFTAYPQEINRTHDQILCLYASGNKMWFGTRGGGFNFYDFETRRFGQPVVMGGKEGLQHPTVFDICADKKGNLWLATWGGLYRYHPDSASVKLYTTAEGLSHNVIYALHCDTKGQIWIGTNGGGLCRFDPASEIFTEWKKDANTVHCIAEGPDSTFWLGTKNGLSHFDPRTELFVNYTELDGLSGNFINGILFDRKGNLWISTNNGLTRFNPDRQEEGQHDMRRYHAEEGLQGDEFNRNAFLKTRDGRLFFGGTNGFNHFTPEQVIDNPYAPPLVFTAFQVLGKAYPLDTLITYKRQIELPYYDNFFSFEFAALDYVLPEQNLYSYKMEGYDEDWSIPGTRSFASYTGLPGGEYIFRVRGSNSDGVWNEEGISIRIRVVPPFYATPLFYAGCVLLGILLVFITIRLRLAGIRKDRKKLRQMVALRTRELEAKNADVMSSIGYARLIQEALLPDRALIRAKLPESFIFYRPKEIVSGDFYWFAHLGDKIMLAVVDCTGHGVPGAFMSVIGHNLLNQIVREKKVSDPAQVLWLLRDAVRQALGQDGRTENRDGMDVACCTFDTRTRELYFAGAFRSLILIRQGNLEKIDGDKIPIGGAKINTGESYQTHVRQLQPGDTFYIYSDGFPDQFGGAQGKKFMTKSLHRFLLQIQEKNMDEQQVLLEETFDTWKGELEQVDDVLMIGVRV